MNFGGSSWGSSTGFGASSKPGTSALAGAPSNTGLFGNSSTLNQNNTVNNNQTSQLGIGGGLFGNSQDGQNKRPTGGLFGSSAPSQPSGGLFGNSSAPSQNASGGLFGNSSNQGSGLFGNSSTNANPASLGTSGLFNKPATGATTGGGLFGNSASNTSTGGLFGSSSTNTAPSGGLFGNSKPNTSTTGGLFGSSNTSNTGGLFGSSGNNNTSNTTGGLFGNKPAAPSTGGLFGGSNTSGGLFSKPATSGGLFGNSSNQQQAQNPQPVINLSDPYSSGQLLSTIQHSADTMPISLTEPLFGNGSLRLPSISKPLKQPRQKLSLLGKLAQTFNIFRYNTDVSSSRSSPGKLKGLLTQLNYIREGSQDTRLTNRVTKPQKKISHLPIENKAVGQVKRLVIQSRPHKFHQINADKVFSAKRRRVLVQLNPAQIDANDYEDLEVESDNVLRKEEPSQNEDQHQAKTDNATDSEISSNGYWCSPSISKLESMTPEELSAVENFIVGRKSKGQIAYLFPVDLTTILERCQRNNVSLSSVLFDDIIKIEDGYVKVYFDYEGAKPPISRELNVPATITLKSEPKNRSLDDHIKRLKRVVGAEFVTYDPIEYNWTFKVKHFSVWGLLDDIDDDTEETKTLRAVKKRQDEQENEASKIYSRIYEDPTYQKELKRQKVIRQSEGVPGAWDYGSIAKYDNSLAIKQQLVEDEITRQVNAYKDEKSADALAANVSDITVQSSSEEEEEDDMDVQVPVDYANEEKFDYLKQIVSVLPPYTDMKGLVDEKAYEPVLDSDQAFLALKGSTSLPTSDDWLVQLEMGNDVNSALTPFQAVPRKQGLALKNVNDILFSDFNKSSMGMEQISTPIKKLSPAPVDQKVDFNKDAITKLVQTLLVDSSVSNRTNTLPLIKISSSITFSDLANIDRENVEMLKLASILFDTTHLKESKKYNDIDESDKELVAHLQRIEKRKAFASWLQIYNKGHIEPSADSLETIFHKVINGQLKEAIELAIASRNVHLSVILTLLDSNDEAVRGIAKTQLEAWPLEDNVVPEPIVKIYQLLSGDYKILDTLPPSIKLGVLAYYSNPAKAIHELLDEVTLDDSRLGHLLKFYKEFVSSGTQAASSFLQTSKLDISLRWMLSQILNIDSETRNVVSKEFGTDLAGCGLWKEALFAFAVITDDNTAQTDLRRTVMENIKKIKFGDVDEEEYLTGVLKIPRTLIDEAVAEEKDREKDYWGKGDALVSAGLWGKAHENIVAQLGPIAVIQEDYATWARLILMIDRFPDKGRIIPSWNQGAGLFAAYFELLQAREKLEDISPEKITYVLQNLAQFTTDGVFQSKVALSIMAKKVGDIAIENRPPVTGLKESLSAIQMGENERNYFEGRFAAIA